MTYATGGPRHGQRGMSMVEVLVALAILVVASVIALALYDASRKSFKRGENVTEQQQAVRIAFDKLNADLRMAGFNSNPDGVESRPDEQIEAAYDTAVVIRADYDAEDPANSSSPETALATGSPFRVVTTGNFVEKVDLSRVDEIGFADLMPGSGHGPGGWVDVAQFEVYARPVPRAGATQ